MRRRAAAAGAVRRERREGGKFRPERDHGCASSLSLSLMICLIPNIELAHFPHLLEPWLRGKMMFRRSLALAADAFVTRASQHGLSFRGHALCEKKESKPAKREEWAQQHAPPMSESLLIGRSVRLSVCLWPARQL